LPLQPVAPPSPDYIPGPENPQTPPVPQDEDEHEFLAEKRPLPGHVTESDPEEDPEEYEDDETEDGPVDYPMDGGDDGDDDDDDSSRDDANDEDEDEGDEEDEEEEEHLAPADPTTVIPVDEPIFPHEGTEPVIPPPFTNITVGTRITVRPQTYISLPPEVEVERLLVMTTPSPSPPISLSPPSAGERLARDDIPEFEQPPRKRLCLSTLGPRYKVGESSTARPTRGQGIDYGLVSTVDAKERVTELAELHKHDTHDLYALLEDAQDRDNMDVEEEAYASREAWAHSIGLSQGTLIQTQHQVHETRFQMQQAELAALRETDRRRQAQMRGARQPRPDARILNHQDASGDSDSHI
ncbi:hypothetical protein Tco_0942024, partial [Tanacetum coccineum]